MCTQLAGRARVRGRPLDGDVERGLPFDFEAGHNHFEDLEAEVALRRQVENLVARQRNGSLQSEAISVAGDFEPVDAQAPTITR